MKIIEAMKRVKMNDEKVKDLQQKIAANSANLSIETPLYSDTTLQIQSWLQTCTDLSQESVRLLCAIQRTNLATQVAIEIADGVTTTKSISEWVWRRRIYAAMDRATWMAVGDRGLKEGMMASTIKDQAPTQVTIVRHYDPKVRDSKVMMYQQEPTKIDSSLEIVNAVTDLIE